MTQISKVNQMTRVFRINLFTGPCGVAAMAARLRTAAFVVVCEGTEHVHFMAPDQNDGWGAIGAMAAVADALHVEIGANDWQIIRIENDSEASQ